MKSISERIDYAKELLNKASEKFKSQKSIEKEREIQYYQDLKSDAEEGSKILSGSQYPRAKRFWELELQSYQKLLNLTSARSLSGDEVILSSARLSAKIELLEAMINNPQRLIDELKAMKRDSQ